MKLLLLIFFPVISFAQVNFQGSVGAIAIPDASGAVIGLHHQATELWNAGLSGEVLRSRKSNTTSFALVMVHHFTPNMVLPLLNEDVRPLLNFSIGGTVAPAAGAFIEGGLGLKGGEFSLFGQPFGRLVISVGYRQCYMPRTEPTHESRGVPIIASGVYARLSILF